MKWLIKLLFRIIILGVLVFGGLTVYFRHVTHLHLRLVTAIENKYRTYHIHPLEYAQIPLIYRQAVIATEDRRFSYDPGIDPIGIFRSIVVDVNKDGYIQGGSTITQQLVDNTLMNHGKSITYKVAQAIYAIGVYDTFSKADIFQMYANVIYFGQGAYGLYNASMTYFGMPPNELNDGELTLLAGLPNAPTDYNPLVNLSLARKRQAIVVENLLDAGMITQTKETQILHDPLRVK